jgi:hypothetical protein
MVQVPLAVWTAAAGNPRLGTNALLRTLIRVRNSLGKNNPLVRQFEEGLNSIRNGQVRGRR